MAFAAAADLVANLTDGYAKTALPSAEVVDCTVSLPGADSEAKKRFEAELQRLTSRVRQLEIAAHRVPIGIAPYTPSEPSDVQSKVGSISQYGSYFEPVANTTGSDMGSPPAKRLRPDEEAFSPPPWRPGDETSMAYRAHQESTNLNVQYFTRAHLPPGVGNKCEDESVAALSRELLKHQKANEAFQKALREIGQIVTAVARGDLTMKVHMNEEELDPEIHTFKRTINDMTDKLQQFASEVSRVAREVGTEGLLGGQAIIEGVDGTWKELTDNGKPLAFLCSIITQSCI